MMLDEETEISWNDPDVTYLIETSALQMNGAYCFAFFFSRRDSMYFESKRTWREVFWHILFISKTGQLFKIKNEENRPKYEQTTFCMLNRSKNTNPRTCSRTSKCNMFVHARICGNFECHAKRESLSQSRLETATGSIRDRHCDLRDLWPKWLVLGCTDANFRNQETCRKSV